MRRGSQVTCAEIHCSSSARATLVDRPMRTAGNSRAASSSKIFDRLRPSVSATSAGRSSRLESEDRSRIGGTRTARVPPQPSPRRPDDSRTGLTGRRGDVIEVET